MKGLLIYKNETSSCESGAVTSVLKFSNTMKEI